MPARWRLMKVLPTATLTAATFTLATSHASALFPPLWPVSPPVSVIVPPATVPPVVVIPHAPPPPFNPPPIVVPPVTPPPVIVVPPTTPNGVPEPSSLLAGLSGLAAAAGFGVRRRRDATNSDSKK
jgi:hypothetical protein